ncbi:hypothetical protein JX266_002906 [Neoarthrinium moseri]|nr:hypothetical protein JX266_002906 [Neoarthrinium moseri]
MSTPSRMVMADIADSSLASSGAPPKRRRLNFACNYCRSRKSRCDEQKPSCRACLNAGIPCVTVDRRRPGVSITRHEAGAASANNHAAAQGPRPSPTGSSTTGSESRILPQEPRRLSAAVPLTPRSTSETHEDVQQQPKPLSTWKPLVRAPDGGPSLATDVHAETDDAEQTTKFSGRLPMLRPNSGSSTTELLTDWLDLAFRRLGIRKRLGPLLTLDDSHAQFQQPALRLDAPPLPDPATCQELLFLYLEEVNSVFPLLDAVRTSQMLDLVLQLGPSQFAHDHGFLPLLLVYLVLSLGSLSHERREWRDFSETNLNFCRSFVGHMIGWNTLQSVQVFFLMSLCLKGHDRISASWSALSLCVTVGTTLALNRPGSPSKNPQPSSKPDGEVDRRRTWWCIYVFERLFAFEIRKPPLIHDESCYGCELGTWSFSTDGRRHPRPAFLNIVGGLADTLGEIERRAIRARDTEETAGTSGIDGAIREKIKTIAESCAMLTKWADALPEEYRPRSDFIYDTGSFPYASFISIQYHHALLMLTQNSLLLSPKTIQVAIDNVAKGMPWEHLVRNGPTITTNAARRMIQLLIEAADTNMKPLFPSLLVPLHSLYVLSINIIRHPKSRMARSDLNLIHDAADFARHQYSLLNSDTKLGVVLDKLDSIVGRVLESAAPTPQMIAIRKESTMVSSNTTSAAPTPMERRPSQYPETTGDGLGNIPQAFGIQENQGQVDLMSVDFSAVFGESPALSQDTAFSPEVTHDIGWDWADFTQLFPETTDPV